MSISDATGSPRPLQSIQCWLTTTKIIRKVRGCRFLSAFANCEKLLLLSSCLSVRPCAGFKARSQITKNYYYFRHVCLSVLAPVFKRVRKLRKTTITFVMSVCPSVGRFLSAFANCENLLLLSSCLSVRLWAGF